VQAIFETPQEMRVHLAALRAIAEADGVVTDQEARYLENLGLIYRSRFPELADSDADASTQSLPSLLQTITGARNKLVFLQDLLSMASVDGVISPEETTKIAEIADHMGVVRTNVERLFELNRDLVDANNRLAEFLFSN
jgi:tellurite resistance protein